MHPAIARVAFADSSGMGIFEGHTPRIAAKCLLNRFNLFVKLPLNLYGCWADMKEAFVFSAAFFVAVVVFALFAALCCGKVLKHRA